MKEVVYNTVDMFHCGQWYEGSCLQHSRHVSSQINCVPPQTHHLDIFLNEMGVDVMDWMERPCELSLRPPGSVIGKMFSPAQSAAGRGLELKTHLCHSGVSLSQTEHNAVPGSRKIPNTCSSETIS